MSAIPPTTVPAGTSVVAGEPDASWLASSWWQQLQPGSWRGYGFVMTTAETRAGRRVAEHDYPYRDTIWAEDLGKLPRRFAFQAFLIGDDVYQQRDAMIAACEQPGEGTLVHPTLGPVQCVLLDFAATDRSERGRVVELSFSFVVSSTILFPQTAIATGDNTNAQASALDQAAQSDLAAGMTSVGTIPPLCLFEPRRLHRPGSDCRRRSCPGTRRGDRAARLLWPLFRRQPRLRCSRRLPPSSPRLTPRSFHVKRFSRRSPGCGPRPTP